MSEYSPRIHGNPKSSQNLLLHLKNPNKSKFWEERVLRTRTGSSESFLILWLCFCLFSSDQFGQRDHLMCSLCSIYTYNIMSFVSKVWAQHLQRRWGKFCYCWAFIFQGRKVSKLEWEKFSRIRLVVLLNLDITLGYPWAYTTCPWLFIAFTFWNIKPKHFLPICKSVKIENIFTLHTVK